MDFVIAEIRYGIHMCNKSNRRDIFLSFRRRKFTIQIALIIKNDFCQTKFLHFFFQLSCQIKLTHRRRNRLTFFIARCPHRHITDQSFLYFHIFCSSVFLNLYFNVHFFVLNVHFSYRISTFLDLIVHLYFPYFKLSITQLSTLFLSSCTTRRKKQPACFSQTNCLK